MTQSHGRTYVRLSVARANLAPTVADGRLVRALHDDRPPTVAWLVAALLLFYPILGQLVGTEWSVGAFAVGGLVLSLWFLGNRMWDSRGLGVNGLIWLALALVAAISHVTAPGGIDLAVFIFVITILLSNIAATGRAWGTLAFQTLLGLTVLHGLATLVFYVRPELYDRAIRGRLFQEYKWAVDYKASLTANPGYNAMFIAFAVICLVVPLIVGTSKRRRWSWLLAGAMFAALLLTAKRAHPLYVILTLVIIYLFLRGSRRLLRVVGVATLGLATLSWLAGVSQGVGDSLDRMLSTFEADDFGEATSGRPFLWGEALAGWRESPLVGNGWGTFHAVWPNGRTESYIAHNQLLHSLYEVGVVGTGLFVLAATGALIATARKARLSVRTGSREDQAVLLISLAIQGFLLLYSCTGGELMSKPYTFIPYFLAIAASASVDMQRAADREQEGAAAGLGTPEASRRSKGLVM